MTTRPATTVTTRAQPGAGNAAQRMPAPAIASSPAVASDASAQSRKRQWLEENREAIQSWNDYVEKHGLPLAGMFEP